jgi:hypothetical protein
MKRLLLFISFGLLTSIPGEILNQILARHDLRAFRSTMVSYVILLFLGFFAAKGICRVVRKRCHAALINYLFFGALGLMVEWFLLGNSPVIDPFQIVVQPGMFTFWAAMLLTPWLLMEPPEFSALKRRFVRYFVGFSLLYLSVAVLLPKEKGGIFIGFVIFATGYVGLNYYFWQYFKLLKSRSPSDGGKPAGM